MGKISKENIWLSLDGSIKIGNTLSRSQFCLLIAQVMLVMHSTCGHHVTQRATDLLLDFPIFAELVEEMMLSRYHLVYGQYQWSPEALQFLSCTLSGSLGSLTNVRTHQT